VNDRESLATLARSYGVQAVYTDATGRRRVASRESVLATLRQLGAAVERPADASRALREHALTSWRRVVEPVVVAWEGRDARVTLRLPRRDLPARVAGRLKFEGGAAREVRARIRDLPVIREERLEGQRFVELGLSLGADCPLGYHRLVIEAGRRTAECLVIVAPRRADDGEAWGRAGWGVFLPLYAVRNRRNWGAGNYADLGRLARWTADLGGHCVGTLPLLPTWLDEPFEPSPYLPVSRLFWSEFHLDIEDLPSRVSSPAAARLMRSRGFRRELVRLREMAEVDHRAQMALQRSVLERAAEELHASRSRQYAAFREFLRARPEVMQYARFRAVVERLGRPWHAWPERMRRGRLRRGDGEPAAERYHGFCQWLAAGQVADVADDARARGAFLYLDLPLGVHPDGYDTWRHPALFATGASAGAPPDAFFTGGQCWGLPPIVPEASRVAGHSYWADSLRHHMRHAGLLRIDHVMSLHRLFWIPDGHGPEDGVYVRYPTDELYAVLCLESRRHGCVVAGEDLGTVPRAVRPAMRRHGLLRTCVTRFERGWDPGRPLASMKIDGVAALQTHDMPTFAAFWRGLDIALRARLGHLSPAGARREREARGRLKAAWLRDLRRASRLRVREPGTSEVLRACLAWLADSPAALVLVDLEDLWLETRAQNVPGTTTEWPNWRRKTRYPVEVFTTLPRVLRALRDVARRRAARRGKRGAR
jgi:4-alpha-glucanotransferase